MIRAVRSESPPSVRETASPELAGASALDLVLIGVRLRARRRAAWLAHLSRGGAIEGAAGGVAAAPPHDRRWATEQRSETNVGRT